MCSQHGETFPATLPLPSARHVSSRLLNAPPGHSPASSPPSPRGLRPPSGHPVSPAGNSAILQCSPSFPPTWASHDVSPTHALFYLCCLCLGTSLHHCRFGLLQQPPNSASSDCLWFLLCLHLSLGYSHSFSPSPLSPKSRPNPLSCQT